MNTQFWATEYLEMKTAEVGNDNGASASWKKLRNIGTGAAIGGAAALAAAAAGLGYGIHKLTSKDKKDKKN